MSADKGHVVHVNSATLIMGTTGSGKSALLATLARYVWDTFGLVSLLYSSDGGGFPASVQTVIQQGLIRLFRMRTRDLPDGSLSFETCQRSAQGWWPARINPATGEVLPGERMVPPITERYDMHCPNGHLVKSVPFQSMLTVTMCPTCKVLTDKSNMQVQKAAHRTKGFEQVGCVMFDGITSELSWMLSDMGQRSGRLELKGEEAAIGGKIISGDMKFGGNTRSHVGFAQNQAEALVLNSLSIPYLVVPPVWTALTMEVDDEGDLRVRGPKLAGRARTDEAPQWFGNCLEAMVVKNEKDQRIYRLCTAEFTDDAGVRHLTKNRADPGILPPYLEDPPLVAGHERETAFTNFNLGVFYQMLDEGLKTSLAEMSKRYPDAPGLPEGLVEVGEAAQEVSTAKPPAPRPAPAKPVPPAAPAPTPRPAAPAPPAPAPAPAAPWPAAPVPTLRPAPAPPPAPPTPLAAAYAPAAPLPAAAPEPTPPPVAAAAPHGTAQPGQPGQLRQRWAAPAAPRPPAPAPRVGAPARAPQLPPARVVQSPQQAAPKTATNADDDVPF